MIGRSNYRSRKSSYPSHSRQVGEDPSPNTKRPSRNSYRRAPETTKDFYDAAVNYCSRRETSRAKMQAYLLRKAKNGKRTLDEDRAEAVMAAIAEALDTLERQKIIDDERYAGILSRDYQRRSKGKRYVQMKLREKGLEAKLDVIDSDAESELERAVQVVEKSLEKTRFKKIDSPFELKQKLLQRLVQSGFDLTLAKKAVALKVR